MRSMRKLTLLIIGTVISGATLFAQETRNKMKPEEKAEKMTLKMTDRLELDESTATKVEAINLEFINGLTKIKSDEELPKEERKSKVDGLRVDHKTALQSVLNAEQLAELEIWEAEKKARMEERKAMKNKTPEERAATQTQKLTELLSLTPEQVERVKILNLKVEEKIEVIKNDETMSTEKKKEFIKGNRQDQKTVLKSILTEEQLVILKDAKMKKKEELKRVD